MAFVWRLQWWALPVIVEEHLMGDTPSRDERQYQGRVIGGATLGRPVDNSSLQGSNFPYHIHHPQSFQEHSHDGETAYPSSQRRGYPGPGQVSSEGAMDMSTLAGALPSYPPSGQIYGTNHPGFQSSGASVGLNPQLQNVASFAGQTPIQSPPFNIAFQSPFGPGSSAQQGVLHSQQVHHQHPGQHQGGPGLIQPPYANQSFYGNTHQHQHQQASQQQQQQFMYYPAPFGQISPSHQQFQGRDNPLFQAAQRRPSEQSLIDIKESGGLTWTAGAQHGVLPYPTPISPGQPGLGPYLRSGSVPAGGSRQNSVTATGAIPSAPRGPPRKPKQSGHALWVGNLPPGAQISDLKDHFSRDATNDIESVFLISKSNCAFVNYRSEAACAEAMTRFHDSRFQGIRLVCRLRRGAGAAIPGAPTGPAALSSGAPQTQTATESIAQNREISSKAEETARQTVGGKVEDKYFIVKSLTVEDLELSARNGIWATQSHNEAALNKAFETTANVYLIFSANKSGEYFGYARMTSRIDDKDSADLDWAPRTTEPAIVDPDLPRSIPTAATEFAPKGRIIDDSARGTIFWEADALNQEPMPEDAEEDTKSEKSAEEAENEVTQEEAADVHAFGKPFKIEWMSTNRLPFYRTRGLRNPWNANREVKIARDGTELETSVGRRLVQMFHRFPPTATGPTVMMTQMESQQMR